MSTIQVRNTSSGRSQSSIGKRNYTAPLPSRPAPFPRTPPALHTALHTTEYPPPNTHASRPRAPPARQTHRYANNRYRQRTLVSNAMSTSSCNRRMRVFAGISDSSPPASISATSRISTLSSW